MLVWARFCSELTQIKTWAQRVAVYLPHQEMGVEFGRLLREQQIVREMTYQPQWQNLCHRPEELGGLLVSPLTDP